MKCHVTLEHVKLSVRSQSVCSCAVSNRLLPELELMQNERDGQQRTLLEAGAVEWVIVMASAVITCD